MTATSFHNGQEIYYDEATEKWRSVKDKTLVVEQSKPQWNIRIDSEHAIPQIFRNGEILSEPRHGLIDFVMHWHTNDERGINKTKWQALIAKVDQTTSAADAVEYYFVEGKGSYAEINMVPLRINTCSEAESYREGRSTKDRLTMHLNIECSDALKGLKAVQREARKATQAVKELDKIRIVGIDLAKGPDHAAVINHE